MLLGKGKSSEGFFTKSTFKCRLLCGLSYIYTALTCLFYTIRFVAQHVKNQDRYDKVSPGQGPGCIIFYIVFSSSITLEIWSKFVRK
jgi:hypothetical protein